MRVIIKKFKTIFWVMSSQDFLRRQTFLVLAFSTNHTKLCPQLYNYVQQYIPTFDKQHTPKRRQNIKVIDISTFSYYCLCYPFISLSRKPLLGGFLQVMLLFNSLRRLITTLRLEVSFFSLLNNLAFFVKGCYYILQRLITF